MDFSKLDHWYPAAQQSVIDAILLQLFIICNLPFSLAENPLFEKFTKMFRPSYKPPCASRLKERILVQQWSRMQTLHNERVARLGEFLMNIEADGWTDIAGRSIFGVITSFIDEQTHYVEALRDLSNEHHTETNMQKVIEEMIAKYGSEKING